MIDEESSTIKIHKTIGTYYHLSKFYSMYKRLLWSQYRGTWYVHFNF